MRSQAEAGQRPSVRVWDVPTRLFHWGLVLVIASAYVSYHYSEALGDNTMQWHRYNGYAALILIVWRVIWGIAGSSTSRFANFFTWPWRAVRYGVDLVMGKDRHYLGHNPLGTYMILALLAAVTLQAVLGMLTTEHNFLTWGPLAHLVPEGLGETVRRWHHKFFDVLLVLIALHILANVFYAVVKRDPLIRAMITGHKPAADYVDAPEAVIVRASLGRAFLCLLLAIALVFGAIVLLGGKLFY